MQQALVDPAGSSPRVWGTVDQSPARSPGPRFIPTCVGNGISVTPTERNATVHPHVCGERINRVCGGQNMGGSSPRVWGTVGARDYQVLLERFIPTCVGNGISTTGK